MIILILLLEILQEGLFMSNKDMVVSMFGLDKNYYWNGHYIVTLSNNSDNAANGILKARDRITKKDVNTKTSVRVVNYV